MAKEELTGNIATQDLLAVLNERNISVDLNRFELDKCYETSWDIFNNYH